MKQGKPLAVEDADSTEMAEDLVGDMGTANEEAGDNICKDDGVTRVDSAEQDTECKSITAYMPATQTTGNGNFSEGYGLFPMKQGKPLAVEDADSTEMAEDLVGDMGTANEEAGDNICKDDGVTRVDSAEQDTECKSITAYMPATQTTGNGNFSEGRLASSPNKEGHLLLTTKPTECTTVEIYIDLNNETSDVAEGNADADLQTASGSCSISALDKASTGDLKKSNTADVLQTKIDTYKASTCEQEKQAEDIPTDDSKPKKPVPDIQKIESSDEDSFTSKSVESTDENYMEIPDEENYVEIPDKNLPDKQTQFLRTDGEAVVVDDDSYVIEIADSPAKQAVAIPEFQSVKGDALKGTESTKPLASKPELLYDRGFLTPVPKSLSKLKQLTVNIGPIRLIDLQCKKLHNLLQINPTCAIKFEPKERTLDNGLKIVDSCGYVRLPFKVSWPSRLVKISDKLSDLNINGRDMSVKFPEAFNKAVQECKAWVQQRNQYLIYTDFKVKQRRVMTQQWPKEETSGEKLTSLFPQVDKIIMQIGKDYDDKDICLAVYLEFATLTALENFMSTGSSSICLDGRLITFTKIIKRVRPHGVPKQVGNTTPTRKNFPAYASQFGASAFGTRGQRGLGQGFRGRGGRDLRGRGGSMGGVRGRAGGIAISPRSTLQKAHYSPGVFPQKTVSKQEAVMNALKMVIETGTPVKTAAKQYGVDHYLLRDKVQRMVDRPTVMTGQGPLFSTEEEAQLVSHVKYMANLGNGLTISEVVAKATDYAVFLKKRTHDNPLSVEWFHRFRRRWPEIKDVQFKDVFSPHNQFEVDLGTRERDKFEPQRDIWSHEPHDDRQRQGDRSRSPSRFEHNKQRQSASKSDETRAMLESMKSKLENLERKLAEQGGSMLTTC
ncbi:uncharacterized protein LOC127867971 [Dreissena polymorpha]|uniref:HTH CENPB-type domain-containing protein n=1 Tax=Dreissena polymorpha TaxID=45954 RepID=A0A9D4RIX5_DREPO|nr:uncharacterized protein LOC127867971 [Dreissena polymorpha]KAH3869278.1 hypothetical protein DPMN_032441 [Dreissena polymorpha]